MLNVKNANQTDPSKEQWGSLFDPGVSDIKHTHAHASQAIQSQFSETGMKTEKEEMPADNHHTIYLILLP